MTDEIVKKCAYCQMSLTAKQLVNELSVRPIGTAFFPDEGAGIHYYFFQHETPDCGTSFVVNVEHFKQFITEPIPDKVLRLGPSCEGHCVNIHDLNDCGQECHFAPFRRFLLKMLAEKKAKIQRVSAL
jgi:hypothetical protein